VRWSKPLISSVCARPGCRRSEAPLLRRFTPAVAAGAQAARLLRNTRSRHSTIDAAPPIHSQKRANAPLLRRADRGPRAGEHRGILDLRCPAGPPQTIVKSQGGASAKPYPATTVRPPARATGPAACAIVTASIAGRTRAGVETTPIVPPPRRAALNHRRERRRGRPVRHVCAFSAGSGCGRGRAGDGSA
jgi:hypothetical protein